MRHVFRNFISSVSLVVSCTIASAAASDDVTENFRPTGTFSGFSGSASAECQLPAFGDPIDALSVNGETPRQLTMPPQYMLVMLALFLDESERGFRPEILPQLPENGIEGPDLCGPLETLKMDLPAMGERFGTISLRMHPSLDLAATYPTFGAELTQSGRVVRTSTRDFAVFDTFENDEEVLRDALNEHPMIKEGSSFWTMPGLILVPLK